jgi:branched-chain amino acid aminotransferase
MNPLRGKYGLLNSELVTTSQIHSDLKPESTKIYEVFRLHNGLPVFFSEHIKRLRSSLDALNVPSDINESALHDDVLHLSSINGIQTGNMKILCELQEHPVWYLYFIPHQYPAPNMYARGVELGLLYYERDIPQVKLEVENYKQRVQKFIRENSVYEALLVNKSGQILEGSRSNVFFIRGNKLFTAPAESVLDGITRQKVLSLCAEQYCQVVSEAVLVESLGDFEACFITGTSPKVLPVWKAGECLFDVRNGLLLKIMDLYDQLMEESMHGQE